MNKLIASATIEGRERRLYANVTPSTTYSYKLWAVGETIVVRGTMLPKVASLVRMSTDDRSLIEGVISLLSGNALSAAQSIATPQLTIAETPAPNVVPAPSRERVAYDVVDIYGHATGIKALVREPQYADHYIADDDSESHNEAIAALQTTLDAQSK